MRNGKEREGNMYERKSEYEDELERKSMNTPKA